jgi:hypothetical protein
VFAFSVVGCCATHLQPCKLRDRVFNVSTYSYGLRSTCDPCNIDAGVCPGPKTHPCSKNRPAYAIRYPSNKGTVSKSKRGTGRQRENASMRPSRVPRRVDLGIQRERPRCMTLEERDIPNHDTRSRLDAGHSPPHVHVRVRARWMPIIDIVLSSAFTLARRIRNTNTTTTAHTPAQTHRPHRRHHSTASVRTNARGPFCTWRIVYGLEVEAMAGYPKKGFRDDKGGRAIVDGARRRVESGGGEVGEMGRSTSRIRGGAGDASGRGGGGGRWCVWYGERRASSI